jgi:trehalose 6-phosphate phosphatase
MRSALAGVSERWPVAIVTGRDLATLQTLTGPSTLTVAASHGFQIWSPGRGALPGPAVDRELLARVAAQARAATAGLPGVEVEVKPYSVAVHERRASSAAADEVRELVTHLAAESRGELRITPGRHVYELQPDLDWHKGRAVERLLEDLDPATFAVYVGDDITDEDGFRAVAGRGAGILVLSSERADQPTAAAYTLRGVPQVERFLRALAEVPA